MARRLLTSRSKKRRVRREKEEEKVKSSSLHRNVVSIRSFAHREIDAVMKKVEARLAKVSRESAASTSSKRYAPRVVYTAKVKTVPEGLQPRPKQVLKILVGSRTPCSPGELAKKLKCSENAIKGAIHYLRHRRPALVAVHRVEETSKKSKRAVS